MFKKWRVDYVGWDLTNLYSTGSRLNGGGFLGGAAPYKYWRVGPLMFKHYW